ncbi:DnaB-like helicase C-terminal domain-containing protein [Brachyspira intermedia]|uniref:DnaB-like helicase C-terminal domain-containing protein n=1 Tax=Brachyspira intermedia TaxID=84377 RepID=UPI003004A05A
MIDKDLVIDKEDYIKNDFINSLKFILNETNKNNIDNNILEIKNKLDEFNALNENNFNLEENILNEKSIEDIINIIVNTKSYNLNNTAFSELECFLRDSLITVGAESSVGKTSFASQLALEILENNDDTILAFYSLDDSKTFLTKKMIQQLLNKNSKKQYNDENITKLIKKHKNDYLKILLSQRIAIFESLNIYNLYGQLIKLRNNIQNNLNIKEPRIIVVIDYLQIIDHESSSLREGLNKICSYLKNIQKKLNCMMILLSQFNRSKETNINTLIRYRETSEIENISDLCINLESIQNNDYYNTKLYIVKNKAGEKNKVYTSLMEGFLFNKFKENNTINTYKKVKIASDYTKENYDTQTIDDFIF